MIELPLAFLGPVGDAIELIFNGVESRSAAARWAASSRSES